MAASQVQTLRQSVANGATSELSPRYRPGSQPSPRFARTGVILTTADEDTQQVRQKYPVHARKPLLPARTRQLFGQPNNATPYVRRSSPTRNDWIGALPSRGQRHNYFIVATSEGQYPEMAGTSRKRPVVANHDLASQLAMPVQNGVGNNYSEIPDQMCRNNPKTTPRNSNNCQTPRSATGQENRPLCRRRTMTSLANVDVVCSDTPVRNGADSSDFTSEEFPVSKELIHRCIDWVRDVELAKLYQGLEPVTLSIIHWND